MVWDVTVVDTLAFSHLKVTSKVSGAAATKAEKNKFVKYEEIRKSYHMIPIAIETFGAWGTEGLCFIKNIGQKIKQLTGKNAQPFFFFRAFLWLSSVGMQQAFSAQSNLGKNLTKSIIYDDFILISHLTYYNT